VLAVGRRLGLGAAPHRVVDDQQVDGLPGDPALDPHGDDDPTGGGLEPFGDLRVLGDDDAQLRVGADHPA
jgi:hypothetical protein